MIEGILETAEEQKCHWYSEKRGEGVNRLVYWVNDNLLEDWIQLPDANPEQIKVAKLIKHICTGNLNATIDSNPPFPGKERHFLRAQIARITHSTVIIPKGLLEIDEENGGKEKYVEDFQVPGTEELKSLEAWGHQHPLILNAGRITHTVEPSTPEDQKEELLGQLNEKDQTVDRFRGINEDTPVPGLPEGMETPIAWTAKVVGDLQSYNQLPPKEGTTTYSVNVIKSLRWPGALTVAQNGRFASIYVGYGIKRGDVCFNPTEPPEIMKDPVDQLEQPEVSNMNDNFIYSQHH